MDFFLHLGLVFFYEYLWFWADSWTLEDAYIAVARRLCPDARQGLCFMHGE